MRSTNLPPLSPNMTVVTRAIFKASRRLIRDFNEVENLQVSRKGPYDFVTNADLASEKILISELQAGRPDYGFLTEESGTIKGENTYYRWIIDPIDGTMNFMHGFPFWCISVALEKDQEVICGAVFDPIRNELFWAEKGVGAFLNDRRIRVSPRKSPEDTVCVIGYLITYEKEGKCKAEYDTIKNEVAAVRRTGSIALNLAYVACGRFDVCASVTPINYWDIAAGVLLVKEAGGNTTDLYGRKPEPSPDTLVAANMDLREKITSLFLRK
ncbi:MAG: inositol monophosphatase [Holosporales bacterium]|jgi:myo-inositol-1(or 4)-monophosphatase|nr:inositol monophosphatase [Holosporales bacterium]